MGVRLWNWIAATALTVVLMALAVPRSLLFDPAEWELSFSDHPWIDYIEIPLYLLGILPATIAVALLGAVLLHALRHTPPMLRAVRFILDGASIFGLSPLQPVFANLILILLVPTLAEAGLLPIEGLSWVFTTALVILFGISLGADLALRVADSRMHGAEGWIRATSQTIGAQAPALAGRLAVTIMAGPLLVTAIASLGQSPTEVAPNAPRFAFPLEGIFVGFVFAVAGLVFWLLARKIGGRPDAPEITTPVPATIKQVVVWGLVALALLTPVALIFTTGDPLLQTMDQVQQQPSGEHRFGTDELGRDIYDRLIYAWRDTVYSGFAIGVVLFGLGIFWRLITPFNRSLLQLEPILERMPPGVIFFGLWGAIAATASDATSIQNVAIASGLILVPSALLLVRRVNLIGLPAAFGSLVLLGTLLVIGWSTVLGQIGLLNPAMPNFGDMIANGQQYSVEAPWMIDYPVLVLTIAVVLPIIAITALARCYGISRDLVRLRG